MKTKYKFIQMCYDETFSQWEVRNNKSGSLLGFIEWYPRWKQWVFQAEVGNIIFSADCLSDIQNFMGQLPKEGAKTTP